MIIGAVATLLGWRAGAGLGVAVGVGDGGSVTGDRMTSGSLNFEYCVSSVTFEFICVTT
jgi:hypothetical protein